MMKIEVIPAVLAKSSKEMKSKIDRITPHVKTIHIDMMDGKFVPNETLSAGDTARVLVAGKYYIFHWMVEKPEEEIPKLGEFAGGNLHLIHAEVMWEALRNMGIELGLAINPETSLEKIDDYIDETDEFLVMSVHPGFSNQKYIPDVEIKIRKIRKRKPDANIEVDGGIGPQTAGRAAAAGANRLAAASAIFGKDDVEKAISDIRKAAETGVLSVQENK
jgi:ribulose-phosphate 3-epimerase